MPSKPIAAVMIHVADVGAAMKWYERAFPSAIRSRAEPEGFEFLSLEGVQLEFVPADEKVGSGASGSVVYWHAPDIELVLARLNSMGATLYRGPMEIENGLLMFQVRDPWRNCIGFRGPPSESKAVT